jgi:hypothetical protein
MNGYLLTLTCPNCAAECDHVTSSVASGGDARAVCKCSRCSREWLVSVYLRAAPVPEAIRKIERKRRAVA